MTHERQRVKCTVPVRTVSEANQREHWAATHRRKKQQQQLVGRAMARMINLGEQWPKADLVVTMCRVATTAMDTDGLDISFKHVRDAVAKLLGRGDAPRDRIEWRPDQRKRTKSEPKYSVEIAIYSVEDGG